MLISGAETARPTAAQSTAVTEDSQSVRQPNQSGVVNGTASDAPTMTFRNLGALDRYTADRNTVVSQRRGNLVLFVKSNENESDGASRTVNNASITAQPNSGGGNNSNSPEADDEEDNNKGEKEDLASLVVSTLSNGGSSVVNAVMGAAQKPLLTTAIVLLYFILLDMVMLQDNERLNRVLRRVRATDNNALILLTTSLTQQKNDAKADLHDALALRNPPTTLERLEMAQHKVLALERVCNRSLARLHMQLMFPGTIDDLAFLVEEHAAYEAQLQRLARDELEWMSTVMSTSVVHASDDVPEGQQFVLGSHAAAYSTPSRAGEAAAAAYGGAEKGDTQVANDPEVAEELRALSNPLHNVRLERVTKPNNGHQHGNKNNNNAGSSARTAQAKSNFGRAAAAVERRRRLRREGKTAELEAEVEVEVEVAAGDLLSLLKNQIVAFLLICLLLAGVLRMG